MAEFCLDCWNRLNDETLRERDVVLSDMDEAVRCEHCNRIKPIVVRVRQNPLTGAAKNLYWQVKGRLRR